MCEWKPDFDNLNKRVDSIETRMTQVERDVGKMRTETQDGFRQGAETMRAIDTSIANLAHDFSQRFANVEAVAVQEKQKWGETLRSITKWAAKVIILGAAVAMGVNIVKSFFAQ